MKVCVQNKFRLYDYYSYTEIHHNENRCFKYPNSNTSIPTFIIGGNILYKKLNINRSSISKSTDYLDLIVALDQNLISEGMLYHDDGETFDFMENKFFQLKFIFKNNTLSTKIINHNYFDKLIIIKRIFFSGFLNSSKIEAKFEYINCPVSIPIDDSIKINNNGNLIQLSVYINIFCEFNLELIDLSKQTT